MPRIDMRKFEDVRCLVRTRVLSSKVYSIEKIVKEHIAEDMWKTYYLTSSRQLQLECQRDVQRCCKRSFVNHSYSTELNQLRIGNMSCPVCIPQII